MNRTKSQQQQDSQSERKKLIQTIQKEQMGILKIKARCNQINSKTQKIIESNKRNQRRLLKYRTRIEQIKKCREKPQYLLAYSGLMNQYVQTFMINHNFALNVDINQPNPDNMTYEQLLELGQKIGKVSKGLSKQQIDKLNHKKVAKSGQPCPICQTQLQKGQIAIFLPCDHFYHDECILQWLKDQNKCPICKQDIIKQ